MSETLQALQREARRLDAQDELAEFRTEFFVPGDRIYLDGNSLGLLSHRAEAAVLRVLAEWKALAVEGWTEAAPPWFSLAETLAAQTADLIGVHADEVIVTNSTTVNLHQLIASLYDPGDSRQYLLTDSLGFPSDLYALQSQLRLRGHDPETHLKLVPGRDGVTLAEDDIIAAMAEGVQMAVFPAVIYTSGQLLDMERIANAARQRNILIGFDCSHSIGAVPHALSKWDVDFAFWCNYKYLNAGPGAVGGLYLNRRHFHRGPGLAGWFSSDKARQFDMSPQLIPAADASAMQIGTPNILSMAPLQGSLELHYMAGAERLRSKSLALTRFLMELIETVLSGHAVTILTPREDRRRGGHVALRHGEAGSICKALSGAGVVPDHRRPDIIRLTPAALYTRYVDCYEAIMILRAILDNRSYTGYKSDRDLTS